MIFKTISTSIILLFCNTYVFSQSTDMSVLNTGDIYKFSIETTGIYKLDYSLLNAIPELNLDNIDPKNIHIYANKGGLIPQELENPRNEDIEEVPILIQGEEDGRFDPSDYIVIYAEGADRFNFANNRIRFEKNVYDLKNYLYLKVESTPGKRIPTVNSVPSAEWSSSVKESIQRHETDRLNLLGSFGSTQGSGKQWFGESFGNEPNQNFDQYFNFPNLARGSLGQIELVFASRADATSQYELTVEGRNYVRNIVGTSTGNIEAVYARNSLLRENININNTSPNINITYRGSGNNAQAWLDYIQIIAQENIVYENVPLYITHRDLLNYNTVEFQFNVPNNAQIWDITDMNNCFNIAPNNNGFAVSNDNTLQAFVVFDPSSITQSPVYENKMLNQNLHGIQNAELLIVYDNLFEEAAFKLANHRESHDGMRVALAEVDQVYNEFAGGRKDPTAIRDLAKMLYDRDSAFKYLLLMGDATYDYRGIVPELEYQNFVPTYQTDESLHPVEAFPSDDYFALLSNNEGDDSLDGALDIGVGRIPCKTSNEALAVVDKIINYDTNPETLGDWRMRIGFTADDEDNNTHIRQADGIARLTELNHEEFNQQKVYFDAFNQESTPGGARYPDAKEAINNNLFSGQLVLNYLGHGGPKGWAQERVFQISDINNLKNYNRLPILITATCSFTGFDEPDFVSAGEEALLNPNGGAIALFSTVRAVYSSQNERITREVFEKLFTRNNGQRLRFGDIIRESQNANSSDTLSSNTRKFMLFGDPSQTIASPKHKISLTHIDDQEITSNQIDTLGALGKMKLKGQITDFNDQLLSSFNGTVFLTVFDKSSALKTLDNDNKGSTFDFTVRKNILYKGSATVTGGQFEIQLILPMDINFEFGQGHLSFYASDNISEDAGGFYDQIVIGGTSEGGIVDEEGPEISIFFDNKSFVFGGQTGTSPQLIIDLADESGINLSSTSIGHDITAVFDNDTRSELILNDFYNPTLNEIGKGSVEYQLNNFEPGLHKIRVKAWDILNNSSEKESEFLVVENLEGFIRNVYNYPNPFSTNTQFTFEHDLINSNLDILINIYTMSGRLIKTIQTQEFSSGSRVQGISWDARDDFSSKLAKGIYLYKINIRSQELNLSRESDFQKLVILN